MRKRLSIVTGIFGAALVAASFSMGGGRVSATVPGTNTLVSVNQYGSAAAYGASASNGGMLSQNGKYYAFTSVGYDVISSDTNNKADVFVRNLQTNTVALASISTSGVQGNSDSAFGVISETGRYVLFKSSSSNLVDGTTISTAHQQLYMRDTIANTTTLLRQNASSTPANADILPDSVSVDGRFVLFETTATNLGPSVTNSNSTNLYMLDRSDSSFTILNYASDGSLPDTNDLTPMGKMSCDGSLVVFQSAYLTTTSSTHSDIYLLDRRAGSKLIDVTTSANSSVQSPSISCNGDYIGFASYATNLDAASGPTSYIRHAYVFDRINSAFTMVDKTSTGVEGNDDVPCTIYTSCVQISDNGIAAFPSGALNLISGVGSTGAQVYIRSVDSGAIELLSRNSSGTEGNNNSVNPTISTDGSIVGYGSNATNLVSLTDANNFTDAFTSLTGY
jgi:hypothetical protein